MECGKRMTQRGICVRLKIVKNGRKGCGLYAAEFIQRGQFVCEYAGELLTTNEARRRQAIYDQCSKNCQSSSALLVVREHLPSGKACLRINIDATKVGNVGRFINHSCDGGNLSTGSTAKLTRLSAMERTTDGADDKAVGCVNRQWVLGRCWKKLGRSNDGEGRG
ncbi:hypothetical protein QQ045_008429 [Rhodiola kirilowii]